MKNSFCSVKDALEYIGGFSTPSKMPSYSYSLPAQSCITGSILRKIKGTVCAECYAHKGCYRFSNVKEALKKRLFTINKPLWADAFIYLINTLELKYFRFFDSGDLQSVEMLNNIVTIAINCPRCKFWLPTKEYDIVSNYINDFYYIPLNLNIRLSECFIDSVSLEIVNYAKKHDLTISTVSTSPHNINCKASSNDGKCGKCRRCWNRHVFNITYPKH